MNIWDVKLRNAAGREVTMTLRATTGNYASNKAARIEEEQTGEKWYVVSCFEFNGEIRR